MEVLIGSGLQIVALDMYQDNMNSREPYIKRIYASHAQVVCLALSLFLLHMHDVVITCAKTEQFRGGTPCQPQSTKRRGKREPARKGKSAQSREG